MVDALFTDDLALC